MRTAAAGLLVIAAAVGAAEAENADADRLTAVRALLAKVADASAKKDVDALHRCYGFRETAKLMLSKMPATLSGPADKDEGAVASMSALMEQDWAKQMTAGAIEPIVIAITPPLRHDHDEFWSAEEAAADASHRPHTVWFADTAAGWKLVLTPVQSPPPLGQPWPVNGRP